MVIAVIALFVSMSGTTYAVTKLPRNSVGSSQLRPGAVRSSDIKNGAVTARKLAKGLRPGQGVSVQAPGRVPYADRAGSADTLDGRDSSDFLARDRIVDVPRFSLGDGQQRQVYQRGPFTLTATCDLNVTTLSGVIDSADILVSTTQDHSVMDGFALNPDLGPGDPPAERVLISVSPPDGVKDFESSADGTMVAPDGTEIRSAVLYAGVNIHNEPDKCFFGGFFMI